MKRMRMKRKEDLVSIANDFAYLSGLHEPPALTKQLVGKMGLNGVPGLTVKASSPHHGSGSHRGHNDGRRGPKSQNSNRQRRR
mmetsp:Transcript_11033/g.20406  ORF Transcript_11033/g.20406 Transcript_11033/m.20406 type:complete len:83 (+) Transcript_11033:938-1186(+)